MNLNTNITLAYLNFKRLDSVALGKLESAKINISSIDGEFIDNIGMKVRSVAFIQKCNAMMILIVHDEYYSEDFLRGRILSFWEKYSNSSILDFINEIQFKYNSDALLFLAEAASGLHSVTIGDSQVMSQITNGLSSGFFDSKPLHIISDWIRNTVKDIKLQTSLFERNTSIERIASELIVSKTNKKKPKGLIFGYGQSGKLVAKILNVENNIPLYIVNRTRINISETELNQNIAVYKSFDEVKNLNDVNFCVVALDNNDSTKELIKIALNDIHDPDQMLFIDISTPPLLDDNTNFIDIKHISNIANKNIENRIREANKARKIITKQLNIVISIINSYIGKKYIIKQKNTAFNLEHAKLDLIVKRAEILKSIRNYLNKQNFIEVTTPYIVGLLTDPAKVDNGSAIEVKLREGVPSFLRQSNQIYKQILIVSGLKKIYEIGPFWRKEENDSYRHLFETIGLDVEIQKPEKLDTLYGLVCALVKHVFDEVENSSNLVIPDLENIPVITYEEAVKLLRDNGEDVMHGDDLGLTGEMSLSRIIHKKYKSDIFVIKNYPDTIKKFYTKEHGKGLTETFDIILDGWELASGAIRQTDAEKIRKSMLISGINPRDYEFYISMVNQSIEHGGFGLGIDRLIAKILCMDMVHDAVLFPRTHKRLIP